MASTDALTPAPLAAAHVDAAVALNAEAGWNQTADDWHFMLAHGHGTGLFDADGRLAATSMVLPYDDRFAWIAMILVTGPWQRRGLATRLMRDAIDLCRDHGWIAGLDATAAGRTVYLPLGFRDVYAVTRWQADAPPTLQPSPDVRRLAADDLPAVAALDAAVFGADRADLLGHLISRAPDIALSVGSNGYVCARRGRVATQIGPLVAADTATAQKLLETALARCEGPVFLDAVEVHGWLADWLRASGFEPQRGFVRMLLDREQAIDDIGRAFINTGPEFA